jgi:hypothetical protein
LFTRTHEHDDRGDSRAPSTSARQAAEALFTPKPQPIEPSSREIAPTGEAARKPRVLAIATARPVPQDEPEAPISAKPPVTPVIPAAQLARIRAWIVAEVYGVAASEIEHILRTA